MSAATVDQANAVRVPHLSVPVNMLMFLLALFFWLLGPSFNAVQPWLCLLSSLYIIKYTFYNAKFPGLFTWFAAAYVALFLVYPTVAPLLHIDLPTTPAIFSSYCLLAVGGIHLFLMGYGRGRGRDGARAWNSVYQVKWWKLNNTILVLLAINVVGIVLVLADAGSLSALRSQSRENLKFEAGALSLAAIYLFTVGSLMYPLLGVYLRRQRLLIVPWMVVIVCIEIFLFLAYRIRTYPVAHLVGLAVGWFVVAPRVQFGTVAAASSRKKLSMFQKLNLLALAVALVLGMFMLRVFRGAFEYAGAASEVRVSVQDSVRFAFEGGGEIGYSTWVFKAMELVPSSYNHLHGQSYYRLLFTPVPRALWPNKPLDTQRIVAQWIKPGAPTILTIPVGIIGDLYINFGMCGMLGMAAFGYLFGRHDRGIHLKHCLFLAVSSTMVFHFTRGAFTNPLLQMIVAFYTAKAVSAYVQGGCPAAPTPAAVMPMPAVQTGTDYEYQQPA